MLVYECMLHVSQPIPLVTEERSVDDSGISDYILVGETLINVNILLFCSALLPTLSLYTIVVA